MKDASPQPGATVPATPSCTASLPSLRGEAHTPTRASTPAGNVSVVLTPTLPDASAVHESPELWAQRINGSLDAAVESLLEVGRALIAAKKALGHGQFGSMFSSGLVRLSQRSAEMFMRVAGHDALSNPNNYSILPKSIHSLNNLAALEAPVIEQAIIAREISPSMTIADTRNLVRRKQGYVAVPPSEPTTTSSANPMELDSLSATESAANPMSAAFDVHAFKATLRQMLERECAKHPRRVGEIQRTATAICSELFQSRPVTSTACVVKPISKPASSAISVESRPIEEKRVLVAGPTSPTSKPAARTSPAPTEIPPRPKTMGLKQKIAQNRRAEEAARGAGPASVAV